MENLTDRITRYLLLRNRRLAILDLYAHATGAGLLTPRHFDENNIYGTAWDVSPKGTAMLTGDRSSARRLVGRNLKRGPAREDNDEFDDQKVTDRWLEPVADPGKTGKAMASNKGSPNQKEPYFGSQAMFKLLREFLPAPNPVHVAMALLVARAVGARIADLNALREVLQRSKPVLLFRVPVSGFERYLGLMLEDALIAAFWASLTDMAGGVALSAHYREARPDKSRRRIITASGRASASFSDRALRRQLSDVLLGDAVPLLIADETSEGVRPQIAAAADIVFECAGIDHTLVAELLNVCCNIPPRQSLDLMERMAFDPSGICLDDLALAVRPGRSLDIMFDALVALGLGHDEDDDDRNKTSRREGSANPKSMAREKTKASPIDIIQPEASDITKAADVSADKTGDGSDTSTMSSHAVRSLRVETLAGYGQAKDWALDLKGDLPLWREGMIGWDEMSTKLLLSGPPGTGKTTFAKALCNTLQVPMIVSSIAWWLESGYLGDVLQQMSATFEAARENAPCIVFIDELDAIGSRGGGRGGPNDDYWTSVITRLLELLDGALRTEGVIVVAATNLPDKIDPALLRSGRLEKHVIIPAPDAEALAGILAHHLGSDFAAVLASAPETDKPHFENLTTGAHPSRDAVRKVISTDQFKSSGEAHV